MIWNLWSGPRRSAFSTASLVALTGSSVGTRPVALCMDGLQGFDGLHDFHEELLHLGFDLLDALVAALKTLHEELEVLRHPRVEGNEVAPLSTGAGHLPEHLVFVLRRDLLPDDCFKVG